MFTFQSLLVFLKKHVPEDFSCSLQFLKFMCQRATRSTNKFQ